MTYQHDFTLPTEVLEQLSEQGLEGLPEMIRVLVNEAMRLERQNHLRARLYERTEDRRGYANGYKPKKVTRALAGSARETRVGEINFNVPQVRERIGIVYSG